MIAVIFELEPKPGATQQYLDIAADLKPLLEKIEGFISVERFESLTNKGKYVSLSFFENEDALVQWRNLTEHRDAQAAGRNSLFKDYRLRVCQVLRDYSMTEREEVPEDSKTKHR